MKSNPTPRAVFCLTAVAIVTASLVACAPKKEGKKATSNKPPAATKGLALDEKTAACELRLREQMETKKLMFQAEPKYAQQITKANELLAKSSEAVYRLRQIKDQTQAVRIEHMVNAPGSVAGTAYTLATFQKGTDAPLGMDIHSITRQGRTSEELRQTFVINSKCEMQLSETVVETIKDKDGALEFERASTNPQGGGGPKLMFIALPASGHLENLTMHFDFVDKIQDKSYFFDPNAPLFQVKVEAAPLAKITKFDLEMEMTTKIIDLQAEGKTAQSFKFHEQSVLKISVKDSGDVKSWKVTKSIWLKERLRAFDESTQPPGKPADAGKTNDPAAGNPPAADPAKATVAPEPPAEV